MRTRERAEEIYRLPANAIKEIFLLLFALVDAKFNKLDGKLLRI